MHVRCFRALVIATLCCLSAPSIAADRQLVTTEIVPASAQQAWNSSLQAYRSLNDEAASEWFTQAITSAASEPVELRLWQLRGEAALARWDGRLARESFTEMAKLSSRIGSPLQTLASIGHADSLLLLRDSEANLRYEKLVSLLRHNGGNPLWLARALVGLGDMAVQSRDLAKAESAFKEALELTAGDSSRLRWRAELGAQMSASLLGDDAEVVKVRLEAIFHGVRRLSHAPVLLSRVHSVKGIMSWRAGDLISAQAEFRNALALIEKHAPGTIPHAGYLNNLGLIHHSRFNYERARDAYQRVAMIFAELQPGSPDHARALMNLALAEGLSGEPSIALDTLASVMAIQKQQDQGEHDIAHTLHAMALNLLRLGAAAEAELRLHEALRLRAISRQHGQPVAISQLVLAEAQYAQGKLAESRANYQKALLVYAHAAPGSMPHAQTLHGLASVARDLRETEDALSRYEEAITVFEMQERRIGGSELTRAEFRARFSHFYTDYLDLLITNNREAQAFRVLQRYRARIFVEMLAERRIELTRHWPDALRERRNILDREYDLQYSKLSSAEREEAARRARQSLERLRDDKRQLLAELRAVVPNEVALHTPDPVVESVVRGALPGDTLLLSYVILAQKTYLFALEGASGTDSQPAGGQFDVFTIPVGEEALRERVSTWRYLARLPSAPAVTRRALAEKSRLLFDTLLLPAHQQLRRAKRVIVVADGPLSQLPFSALIDRRTSTYLVQTHAVDTAVSETVLAANGPRLNTMPKQPAELEVLAFADPIDAFPPQSGELLATINNHANGVGRQVVARARGLDPLPGSRREVAAIARLFSNSEALVGIDASETNARVRTRDPDIVHFAVHGLVDERSPLDSALVLAADTSNHNGLLQAWEVLQELNLRARLVVLSGCETALGKAAGGEGLLGLTRAFHFAGAERVLASLWPVSDRSTSELMRSFYEHLRAGRSEQDALRDAKTELIGQGRFDHPFYWAGFKLSTTPQRR